MADVDDTFFARRVGQLLAERVIEPHRQIAFDMQKEMEANLPDDVKGFIGDSHIAFGAACSHEAYEKLAEHNAAFDLQWQANMRGIEKWREDNPGNDLVMPDHADLVAWLLDKAFPAQRMEARSDETLQAVQPEGREPAPKDAPETSFSTSQEGE